MSLILKKVHKTYPGVQVLSGADFTAERGDFTGIIGPSGSGKSTLLNIMGSLDKPDSGFVKFDGNDLAKFSADEAAIYRRRTAGFVFQEHHLLPQLTALENVLLPCLPDGVTEEKKERALKLLNMVGLKKRAGFFPSQMSGGEKQRTAVARAVINEPSLLLCDEPTGNLDFKSGHETVELFASLAASKKTAVIMVTHNLELIKRFTKCFELTRGKLVKRKK
jgi:ABC-type lipoprotein export system ATPase subunit